MPGLQFKYLVQRVNPSEKHDGCDYFVLDLTHDTDAQRAALHYAELTNNHELRADLLRLMDGE